MTRFILVLALASCSAETSSHAVKPARYRYVANGVTWYLDPVTKTWEVSRETGFITAPVNYWFQRDE